MYELSHTYSRKVRKLGKSLEVIIPKEVCTALKLSEGDQVTFKITQDKVQLVPYDAEYEKWIIIGDKVMKEHRSLLRAFVECDRTGKIPDLD